MPRAFRRRRATAGNRESVGQVLRKTAYYGDVKGPADIVVKVPAILTRAEWDRAHDALRRNRIVKVGRTPRQYLLSGYLYCARCGKRCGTLTTGEDGAYRCNNLDHTTRQRHCEASAVRRAKLESAVWDALWDALSDEDLLYSLIEAFCDAQANRAKGGKKKADPVLARIERARRSLAHAERVFRDPDQPIPYSQAKADLEAARRELTEAEMQRPTEVFEMPDRRDIAAIAREFRQGRDEIKDFADRRGFIERVVEQIRYADGEAEIACAISLSPKRNCNRREHRDLQSGLRRTAAAPSLRSGQPTCRPAPERG